MKGREGTAENMKNQQGANKTQILARAATAILCVLAAIAIVLVNRGQPTADRDTDESNKTVQESEAGASVPENEDEAQTAHLETETIPALKPSFPRGEQRHHLSLSDSGRLRAEREASRIMAAPEIFFVDQSSTIVGETIVEMELARLRGAGT